MEPKWGRRTVMRTLQLLHVIRCGNNGEEREEEYAEEEEEKEDTMIYGHLSKIK